MSGRYSWPPAERLQITLDPDVIAIIREIITGKTAANDEIASLKAEITLLRQEIKMSGNSLDQTLQTLTTQVEANTDATGAAVAMISAVPTMIQQAVAAALAAGATPQQLQAITDLSDKIGANAAALGTAVTANTPVGTPTP
jgi:hypothetical protein